MFHLLCIYQRQRNKYTMKSWHKNETIAVEYSYHFADWFGLHQQFSEVVIQSGISPASSSCQESQQYIHHVQRVTELINLHQIRENILLSCDGELNLRGTKFVNSQNVSEHVEKIFKCFPREDKQGVKVLYLSFPLPSI